MGYQLWICQPVERRQNQGAARGFFSWLFPKRSAVNTSMGQKVPLLPQLCVPGWPPSRGHLLSSDKTKCVGFNFTPLRTGTNKALMAALEGVWSRQLRAPVFAQNEPPANQQLPITPDICCGRGKWAGFEAP